MCNSLDSALTSLSAATKRDFFPDSWGYQGEMTRSEKARAKDRMEAYAGNNLWSNTESGFGLEEPHSHSPRTKRKYDLVGNSNWAHPWPFFLEAGSHIAPFGSGMCAHRRRWSPLSYPGGAYHWASSAGMLGTRAYCNTQELNRHVGHCDYAVDLVRRYSITDYDRIDHSSGILLLRPHPCSLCSHVSMARSRIKRRDHRWHYIRSCLVCLPSVVHPEHALYVVSLSAWCSAAAVRAPLSLSLSLSLSL